MKLNLLLHCFSFDFFIFSYKFSIRAFQFSLILTLCLVHKINSLDYSSPPLQKCEDNKFSDEVTELEIPSHLMSTENTFAFRITEKCATRLPHCMKPSPCAAPLTQFPISFIPPQTPSPEVLRPQSENLTEEAYYEENDDFIILQHFTPKGYFRYGDEYFGPEDFCLYSHHNHTLVLSICPSRCASNVHDNEDIDSDEVYHVSSRTHSHLNVTTEVEDQILSIDSSLSVADGRSTNDDSFEVCVPKCCSIHKVLDLTSETLSCQETQSSIPWTPLVYRSASRQICGEKRTNLKLHYVQTPPLCDRFDKYFLKPVPKISRVRFRLLTNGTVLLRELADLKWTVLKQGTYCLDGVQNYGYDPKPYMGDPMDQVLLVCVIPEDNHEEMTASGDNSTSSEEEVEYIHHVPHKELRLTGPGIAYVVLLFSGVPFLLITVSIYVLIWNKQNVHGWTQFSHTLAVLLHYLAQAVANTVSRILNSDHNASSLCRIVGISNHFFVLASFCWLTVINYDLFSMFRHLKTTVGRSRGLKRFLVYMAVAWGLPLVVVIISVILDRLYGLYGIDGDCEVDVIVPLYGHRSCYMGADAQPYYLFYPVGFLMGLNLILAVLTFINMYKHDQSAKMATQENSTKHRRKYAILAKLFVVMGLVWIFEMFVWLFIKEGETLPWYLVFPDVFNFFQAVAIFNLFACQPKILNQVADSYPKLKGATEVLKKFSCNRNNNNNLTKTKQLNSSNVTNVSQQVQVNTINTPQPTSNKNRQKSDIIKAKG